jgi:aldehyde dehydrogenase (NAD+)
MQRLLQELELSAINPGTCCPRSGWRDTLGLDLLDCRSPATGELIAQVALCGDADYENLLEESVRAQTEWRALPAAARGELIGAVAAAVLDRREALAALAALETGKTLREAESEVDEVIDWAELAARLAPQLDEPAVEDAAPHGYREHWSPLGVAGIITHFDAPLSGWAKRAFPAAVCGNTTIWKPSPKAPLCALALLRLAERAFEQAGLPRAFCLLVPEGVNLINRLVRDTRLPLVAFSGSTFVGRQVAVKVADRLGHSLLELPASNAVIVDESADLDAAVEAILASAVRMAGQSGSALRRVIVHEAVCGELAEGLVEAYRTLRIGDPLAGETDFGPLIDSTAVAAYQEALEEVQQQGGDVLWGGRALEGCFVEPALVKAENHWESVQREAPLPILYLIPFHSFEEALALQGATTRPCTSTLFTGDMEHVARYLSEDGAMAGAADINADFLRPGQLDSLGNGRDYSIMDLRNAYMKRQIGTVGWNPSAPLPTPPKKDALRA